MILLVGLAVDPLSLVRAVGHLTKCGVDRENLDTLAIGRSAIHRANIGRVDLTLIHQQADRFEGAHIEESGIGNHHGLTLAILRPSGIEFRRSGTALNLYCIEFKMFISVLIDHERKPHVGLAIGVVGASFDKFHTSWRACRSGQQHHNEKQGH